MMGTWARDSEAQCREVGVRGFGDLEAVVMDRVWSHDAPLTVRDLFEELSRERAIAYTTVMSTMDNLHRKGWLTREREGKAYRYRAVASREEYSARLMREALAEAGDAEAVLSHFVAAMADEESAALRAALGKLPGRRLDADGRAGGRP
jgi:predicted transcriptional regulator